MCIFLFEYEVFGESAAIRRKEAFEFGIGIGLFFFLEAKMRQN